MNLNELMIVGVYDAFGLGDTRAGATLDPVPTFMTMRLDRALLRASGARGRGAARAFPTAVLRRAVGPSVFTTTWAYIDYVLVPPGASTSELTHDAVGEAYDVLAGSGTVTITSPAAETAPIRTGDAILIRIGESSVFANTVSEPLELFVTGMARDSAPRRTSYLVARSAEERHRGVPADAESHGPTNWRNTRVPTRSFEVRRRCRRRPFGLGRVVTPAHARTKHIRLYVEMDVAPARERECSHVLPCVRAGGREARGLHPREDAQAPHQHSGPGATHHNYRFELEFESDELARSGLLPRPATSACGRRSNAP